MIALEVQKIHKEIQVAIDKALEGEDPELKVTLEDEKLDYESYKQIITKIYAVIRFKLYQKIKVYALKSNSSTLSEATLKDIVKELDIEVIRREVFKLFEISFGLDTQLSLRKIQYLYSNDEMFQMYLNCLKQAHDRCLNYIFQGYRFKKMEQNPLHSKDLNYGLPSLFNEILDEFLDDTHQVLAEEFQYEQIRKFTNNVSPRAKVFKGSHLQSMINKKNTT